VFFSFREKHCFLPVLKTQICFSWKALLSKHFFWHNLKTEEKREKNTKTYVGKKQYPTGASARHAPTGVSPEGLLAILLLASDA